MSIKIKDLFWYACLIFIVYFFVVISISYWNKGNIVMTVLSFYLGVTFMSIFFKKTKYGCIVFNLLFTPFVIATPFKNILKSIAAIYWGITLIGLVSMLVYINLPQLMGIKLNMEQTLYLILTTTAIISTQKFYQSLCRTNVFMESAYNINIAKYIIYFLYFVSLVVINIFSLGKLSCNIYLLPSFATFIAYDRLISNKELLKGMGVGSITDMFADLKNLWKFGSISNNKSLESCNKTTTNNKDN